MSDAFIRYRIISKNALDKLKISLYNFFKQFDNFTFVIVLIIYIVIILSVIQRGIPGTTIALPYDLDEYSPLRAVYNILHYHTNNMSGSSRGPMFFYLLTGGFLAPFYFLHIFNLSAFTHNLIYTPTALTQLHRIFILLRLHALLFNICSLILIYKICKDELHINSSLAAILFISTPVWLIWSVYHKYDVGFIFWIICSIYTLLLYRKNPSRKIFMLNGIIAGFAISTKPTAWPVVPFYIVAYFLFSYRPLKQISTLIIGLLALCLTFFIVGIPDVLLLHVNWGDYVSVNTLNPTTIFGMPWYIYLLIFHYPLILGYGFYTLFLAVCVYYILRIRNIVRNYKLDENKVIIFLISGFLLFAISLAVITTGAVTTRLFVIIPFLVLLTALAVTKILKKYYKYRIWIYFLLVSVICVQIIQSYAWFSFKYNIDTRVISSNWISKNIKPSTRIGLEIIPVYEGIPNALLLDFQRQLKGTKGIYKYSIIDSKTPESKLPEHIVIVNPLYLQKYSIPTSRNNDGAIKGSLKEDLINNIRKNGWHIIASFQPDSSLLRYFGSERDVFVYFGISSIDIYYKNKTLAKSKTNT